MTLVKKAKWIYIAVSAALIALGICLIAWPNEVSLLLCYIAAAGLIVAGAVKMIGYFKDENAHAPFKFDFALGFAVAVVGILIIVFANAVISMFVSAVGIYLIVESAVKFQTGIDAKRFGFDIWLGIIIAAVVSFAAGIFLIINPIGVKNTMMIITGIGIVYDGLQNILSVVYVAKLADMVSTEKCVYEFNNED